MPTRNISLPESLDQFVEDNIKSCRYDNASEVVRCGLRLLELADKENLAKLDRLREAVAHGMASGIAPDGSRERIHQHIQERVAERG